MLSGNYFYCILNTFSVINLKPCLNGVFDVNIYLFTCAAPLALQGVLQGVLHH